MSAMSAVLGAPALAQEDSALIESLNRIEKLQAEVLELRNENRDLRRRFSRLNKRMRAMGGELNKLKQKDATLNVAPESDVQDNPSSPGEPSPALVELRNENRDLKRRVSRLDDRMRALTEALNKLRQKDAAVAAAESSEAEETSVPMTWTVADPPQPSRPSVAPEQARPESPLPSAPAAEAAEAAPPSEPKTPAVVYGAPGNAQSRRGYERVMEWLDKNEPERFKVAMREWLDRNPDDAYEEDALYWLAEAHYRDKEWLRAREYYARLMKKFPKTRRGESVRLRVAVIYQKQADYAAAEKILMKLGASSDPKIRRRAKNLLQRRADGP